METETRQAAIDFDVEAFEQKAELESELAAAVGKNAATLLYRSGYHPRKMASWLSGDDQRAGVVDAIVDVITDNWLNPDYRWETISVGDLKTLCVGFGLDADKFIGLAKGYRYGATEPSEIREPQSLADVWSIAGPKFADALGDRSQADLIRFARGKYELDNTTRKTWSRTLNGRPPVNLDPDEFTLIEFIRCCQFCGLTVSEAMGLASQK